VHKNARKAIHCQSSHFPDHLIIYKRNSGKKAGYIKFRTDFIEGLLINALYSIQYWVTLVMATPKNTEGMAF
jgi:hypothetical protein